MRTLTSAFLATLLLTACFGGDGVVQIEAPQQQPEEPAGSDGMTDNGYPMPVERSVEVLANAIGIPQSEISVVEYEEAEWPDGCLGLTPPDTMCTQVVTPGYRINLLTAQGFTYVFRTDMTGDVMYTEPEKKPMMQGTVSDLQLESVEGEDGRISLRRKLLVEGDGQDSVSDRAWVTVESSTVVMRGGEEVTPEDLETGQQVTVTFAGPIAESYPVQGTAERVEITGQN